MNLYTTPSELRAANAGLAGVADAVLLGLIEDVSRWLDGQLGRHFYVKQETRYFGSRMGDGQTQMGLLLVDDLLSLTTLKTDEDGDLDYDITWGVGDYYLYPDNGWPKWALVEHPAGSYSFPLGARTVEIAGSWGYGDGERALPWDASGVTGTVATTGGTTLTLSAAGTVAAGRTLLVGSEQMYVSALNGTAATVVRGVNGTTAATHAAEAVLTAAYPRPIVRACMYYAGLWQAEAGREGLTSERIGSDYSYARMAPADDQALFTRLVGAFRKL